MPICRLDPLLIDRIAAGEVIERPAAAIKELVENALDAGANSDRGRDRGRRAPAHPRQPTTGAAWTKPISRFASSGTRRRKSPTAISTSIATFGFRGEALPSIASVSRLEIRTRAQGAPTGLKIVVEDGIKSAIEPCASPLGTRVEARDLFAATPARLKFLKSDRAEAFATSDVVKRLAMAAPEVALFVHERHRLGLRLAGLRSGRSRAGRAPAPGAGRRVRRKFACARGEPRGRQAPRPGRPADL